MQSSTPCSTARDLARHSVLRRARMLAVAVAIAASAGAAFTLPASAAVGLCRTDPHVLLTDGRHVDVSVSIGDTAADVRQIAYTVHIPSDASVKTVQYGGSALAGRETVTVVADQPANTFVTDTVVTTGTSTTVEAQTRVPGVGSGSASGLSAQDLLVTVAG